MCVFYWSHKLVNLNLGIFTENIKEGRGNADDYDCVWAAIVAINSVGMHDEIEGGKI